MVSGCRGNVLECSGRSKLWNASVLECNLENTLEITFGMFQVLQFLEYPYFLIGTRFGTPLFRNAPGNPTGVPKFGMPLFWNACFGTPHLENPLEISFGTFGVYIFWNAPNLERLGTRFGTPLFWSSPLVI